MSAVGVFQAVLLEGTSKDDLKDLHEKALGNKGGSKNRKELAAAISREMVAAGCRVPPGTYFARTKVDVLHSVISKTIPSVSKETLESMKKEEIMQWFEDSAAGDTAGDDKNEDHGGGGNDNDGDGPDDIVEDKDGGANLPRKKHKLDLSLSHIVESFDGSLLKEMHTAIRGNKGAGGNKQRLVAAICEGSGFEILNKRCVPVKALRSALRPVIGMDVEKMSQKDIVKWLEDSRSEGGSDHRGIEQKPKRRRLEGASSSASVSM